jgi:hypothetical protein
MRLIIIDLLAACSIVVCVDSALAEMVFDAPKVEIPKDDSSLTNTMKCDEGGNCVVPTVKFENPKVSKKKNHPKTKVKLKKSTDELETEGSTD